MLAQAPREQSITRKDEIAEESRLAHKQSAVLSGPGKVCVCVCVSVFVLLYQ